MGDFIALSLCVICLAICFKLMVGRHCRHRYIAWLQNRCIHCYMDRREVFMQSQMTGRIPDKPIYVMDWVNPLRNVRFMIRAEKIEDPNCPWMWREIEEPDPESTSPELMEVWNTMVGRR